MAGYSGTPLARKLGLVAGTASFVLNPPAHYALLLEGAAPPLPLDPAADLPDGLEFLHLFTRWRAELRARLIEARPILAPDGMVWVSWPKKAAKVATDITEDVIRAVALPMGLVDVKVCAVDEVWSGLKLVIRKELRGR